MKDQQILKPGEIERVEIKSHANVEILSWDQNEIGILTNIESQKIRKENKHLVLFFLDDSIITLPSGFPFHVIKCAGNLRLENFSSKISIGKVEGNLAVMNADALTINRINGNCFLRNIVGPVNIGKIYGELKGDDLQGNIICDRVYDDVRLSAVRSSMAMRSEGNIEISLNQNEEGSIKLRAEGDINLKVAQGFEAQMETRSDAEEVKLELSTWSGQFKDRKNNFILGSGKRKVYLHSNGKILVSEESGQEDVREIFTQLERVWAELDKEKQIKKELDNAGSINDSQSILEDIETSVLKALEELKSKVVDLGYDGEGIFRETELEKTRQVSREEKIIIMNLLAENKISIDEADLLIESLRTA